MIVTANLRDFPDSEFAQFGVEAKDPDEFVMDLFNLDGVRGSSGGQCDGSGVA